MSLQLQCHDKSNTQYSILYCRIVSILRSMILLSLQLQSSIIYYSTSKYILCNTTVLLLSPVDHSIFPTSSALACPGGLCRFLSYSIIVIMYSTFLLKWYSGIVRTRTTSYFEVVVLYSCGAWYCLWYHTVHRPRGVQRTAACVTPVVQRRRRSHA